MLKSASAIQRAARWFAVSGIQEDSGGVARYYLSDSGQNARVSNEITGYAVSAMLWFHGRIDDAGHPDDAFRAARFLSECAWDNSARCFPFEPGSSETYFFDTGIIVRGLLAAFRASGEPLFLQRALDGAESLARDFGDARRPHPRVQVHTKRPLPYEARWSREPGCYQLKSALAWLEASEATGERKFERHYEALLDQALSTHGSFLPGTSDLESVADRLHAYCYFLEALLPAVNRSECARALASGIDKAGVFLRKAAPVLLRSDVAAQLLRLRLYAEAARVLPLDATRAEQEAGYIRECQAETDDAAVHGCYYFGKRRGTLSPFANPVSTAFCVQALEMWQDHQTGRRNLTVAELI